MLPEMIRALSVSIGDAADAGQLLKTSTYEFRYLDADPSQPAAALLMSPRDRLTWQDGDLFAPMDQNLPEGDLFLKIRELFPKQPVTPMHMLALIGRNGIGRLGYGLPGQQTVATPRPMSKAELLGTRYTPEVFNDLVAAYLSTGAGIAGMQPKIMVPDRSTVVRNGDAHLKNFGVLYRSASEPWLAPMFDVVTTSIYRYTQYRGGPELEDRTLALKLFAGRHQTRAYPTTDELLDFGRRVCGVSQPARVVATIAQAMQRTLDDAKGDDRVPPGLRAQMAEAWADGMRYDARP